MSFKKLRGVHLPEEKQGLVRFSCLNYATQPKQTKEKIQRLCDECGGAYSAALMEVMCTKKSVSGVAMKYHVSESVLYRARKEFYESWFGLWREN
jgi:DNA-binding phage protein